MGRGAAGHLGGPGDFRRECAKHLGKMRVFSFLELLGAILEYLVDLISSYGILERFLDHLGVIFEPSWPCCMGALGVLLGLKTAKTVWKIVVLCFVELLGDILEYLGDLTSSHGILEPYWGHLGAIFWPFGDMLAS